MTLFLYAPMLRPASFATLPRGVAWDYVETPSDGSVNRPDIPRSTRRYGIIRTDRALTRAETNTFELLAIDEGKQP